MARRGFWSFFVAGVGFIAAILEIVFVLVGLGPLPWGWRVALVVVGALLLVVALILAWHTYKTIDGDRRFSREVTNRLFQLMEDAITEPSSNSDSLRSQLEDVMTSLAYFLTRVCGVDVRACIKVMDPVPQDPNRPHVRTLTRDHLIGDSRGFDDRTKRQKVIHWIHKNTDYHLLHQNRGTEDGEVFFENRLPRYLPYENTSFELTKQPLDPKDYPMRWLGLLMRNLRWPLPYKSTIVVPIEEEGANDICGYLAVDSPHEKVFDRERETTILRLIARFIVPKLAAWRAIALQSHTVQENNHE